MNDVYVEVLSLFCLDVTMTAMHMGAIDQSTAMDRPPSPARLPYTSDKHPRHTLEAINVLRKHRELCDVVLIVGQRKIFAHRVILSACSPYFHAMFTGELAESRQTEVTIRDIDENAMELLIDFCYTSAITVEESNVQVNTNNVNSDDILTKCFFIAPYE